MGGPVPFERAWGQPSIPLEISISDLISKINPKDGEFIKYVPDGMLSESQLVEQYTIFGVSFNIDDDISIFEMTEYDVRHCQVISRAQQLNIGYRRVRI